MIADTLLILFISVATAFLGEGTHFAECGTCNLRNQIRNVVVCNRETWLSLLVNNMG